MSYSWHAWLLLLHPPTVARRLEQVREAWGFAPTLWQVELGVLRMWHRVVFRPGSIGTCAEHQVRPTWRARLLAWRPLRFPFLMAERAIAPWDMSGLLSSPERVVRHLLGAHHDVDQYVYDLEMLRLHEGWTDELRGRLQRVLAKPDGWLRDLCVYDGYHEELASGLDRWAPGRVELSEDPDVSFTAYLRWCAAQPATPGATFAAWRAR